MPKPLSFDLRSRVLAAVDGGLSCRQAAERFGVSPSSAIRWVALRRSGGDARPRPQGGDRLSHKTEAHAALIHAALAEVPDATLSELKEKLAGQGAPVSIAALWRFFRRHKITRKKTAHAQEQDRPDILKRRQDWFEGQLDLDPERLVFIDETWASTNMTRTHGRAPQGKRLRAGRCTAIGRPPPSWRASAPAAWSPPSCSTARSTATPSRSTSRRCSCPNLSSHKGPRVREMIHASGAQLLYLPPYSPDFNPIEKAFSKLKALLRKAAERTVEGLWTAIGRFLDAFTPTECANYFTACGYGPT